jgi:hypothetical protein
MFAFAADGLSGEWCTDITFDPQATTTAFVTAFESTLSITYTIGSWSFTSDTTFDLTGWSGQVFSAAGVLGAFTISSELTFDPAAATFERWETSGSVSIAGVSFNGAFLLQGIAGSSGGASTYDDYGAGWLFGMSGTAGSVGLAGTALFNLEYDADGVLQIVQTGECCICFSGLDLEIEMPFCCLEAVAIEINFTCVGGFDGICFDVTGIAVPAWPWLTFDATLCFDEGEDGKSLTIVPVLNLGEFECVTLYYRINDSAGGAGWTFESVEFYGIELNCTFNGIAFRSASSFGDEDDNEEITGNELYWEVFCISYSGDGCCGGAYSFDVCTYFAANSAMLFDWGETVVDVSFGITSNFTINTGLTVDSTGFVEWTLGACVTF